MLSYLRFLPFLFVFSAVADGGIEFDAEAYASLKKMWQASRQLNYEGTFVYLNDGRMETMRVVHTVDGENEKERLTSLNGVQREVVKDNHSVVYILPDSRLVAAKLRNDNSDLPLGSEEISQYYQLKTMSDERVAGKLSNVILIMPLDNYRYGHRLSIDAEHGLPLKSEVLDSAGDTVSQIMFTQLHVDPDIKIAREDDSDSDVMNRGEFSWVTQVPARRLNAKESASEESLWSFPTLPDGFRLTVHARRPATGHRDIVDHFLFSDGLASFSVYIERIGDKKGLTGASRMGAVNVYGRRMDEYQITAVGEIPERTVREVAKGVTANREVGTDSD